MTPRPDNAVTQLLAAAAGGEASASDQLLAAVYEELRSLAASRLSRLPPGQTLQATALVHEAYLRLLGEGGEKLEWNGRGHFFGAAANAMRNILVEQARRKARVRHGGELRRVDLDDAGATTGMDALDLLSLDAALERFTKEDPRRARVVMLRYFAGLSIEDTAAALEVAPATVKRDWVYAKAWLLDAIEGGAGEGGGEPGQAGRSD